MDKTSFNVKIFDWDYWSLTALTKETYSNDVNLTYQLKKRGSIFISFILVSIVFFLVRFKGGIPLKNAAE